MRTHLQEPFVLAALSCCLKNGEISRAFSDLASVVILAHTSISGFQPMTKTTQLILDLKIYEADSRLCILLIMLRWHVIHTTPNLL